MPEALYLYNSADTAAGDFYRQLKRALSHANWKSISDFDQGLTGETDDSYTRLAELIRQVDAIVFAVGPRGPGRVQGNFEMGQVLQAKQEKDAAGRRYPVVVALVGDAEARQIPQALQNLTAQMDNAHRAGGKDVLAAVFQAVVGAEMPDVSETDRQAILTTEPELARFCGGVARRAQRRGLTLFVGPYVANDVHAMPGPADLGREVLRRGTNFQLTNQGDLLAHPWIASSATQMEQGLQGVLDVVRGVMKDLYPSREPLPVEARVAALAKQWSGSAGARVAALAKDRPGPIDGAPTAPALWKGLLLVSADQSPRLEHALWHGGVPFDRLLCLSSGTFIHERAKTGTTGCEFDMLSKHSGSAGTSAGTTNQPVNLDPQPILVLKLNGSIELPDELEDEASPPPMTTIQNLLAMSTDVRLPNPLPNHLQGAPFVMLGGGLLNPIVNHAFVKHLLPYFEGWGETKKADVGFEPPPRLVAFHAWPGPGDVIRCFERHADVHQPDWTMDVFRLGRVDWPLPDLLARLANQLFPKPASTGAV